MPRYVIEREIPGAGKLSPQELKAISQKSCSVLDALGPQIQWQQSYVTGDKVYCIYIAPKRGSGARTRPARRVPRQPRVQSRGDDRSQYRRLGWVLAHLLADDR